jgi:hypothetical protein
MVFKVTIQASRYGKVEWPVSQDKHSIDWIGPILTAFALLFGCLIPASADALAGIFNPFIGIPITVGIAALEAYILFRRIGAPHPYRESLIANFASAAVGFYIIFAINFSDNFITHFDQWLTKNHYNSEGFIFLSLIFLITLLIEGVYLLWRWHRFGVKKVMLAVLLANFISYICLIPVAYLSAGV